MKESEDLEKLIEGCKKNEITSQKALYKLFAPKIFGICKRYLKNNEEAEELVMDSFLTIYEKINQLENPKMLVAWMNKITVNNCLMELRKKVNFTLSIDSKHDFIQSVDNPIIPLYEKDILSLLQFIPLGSRAIFNLHVIEGYKHAEIAEMLDISEGTSKSQLNFAKTKLKHLLTNQYNLNQRTN